MTEKNKIIRNRLFVLVTLSFVFVVGVLFYLITNNSQAEIIENDTRIAQNTDLVYYLEVVYDGIDKNVKISSDTAISKVYSDYIYVEDRLPEGLEFVRFVTSDDGSVGAVKRSDNTSCQGYVVGNKSGLKYDPRTKLVSFKIKNLQAGCKLTVGIVTRTPRVVKNDRMDFYNTISVHDKTTFAYTNLEHVFMGNDSPLHAVYYKYEGDVPTNVSSAPEGFGYSEGSLVEVLGDVKVDGYTFSGWKSKDVEVNNNTFVMPNSSVTFTGRFTKNNKYRINYELIGDRPDNYVLPSEKNYYSNSDVKLDSLTKGDTIDDYVFNGWTASCTCGDIKILDNIFTMPDCNVTISGSFTRKKYAVSYRFRGDDIPDNYLELLPKTKYYSKGDRVKVESNPVASGYKFLGWLSSKEFDMEEENVVIYGQWMKLYGYFTPSISMDIINKQEFYHHKDIIKFRILVKNNDDFNINDIMVKSNLDGFKFTKNNNYRVLNDNNVKINNIKENEAIYLYGTYEVNDELNKVITNEIQIIGGIADNNYYLNDRVKYKTSADFVSTNIELVINNVDSRNHELSGAEYSLYDGEVLSKPLSTGISFDNLLPGNNYYLRQDSNPEGFMRNSELIRVSIDKNGVLKVDNHEVELNKNVYSVKVVNKKINMLPVAGGIGVYPFIFSGLIIIVIGFVLFITNYKNKDLEEELEII